MRSSDTEKRFEKRMLTAIALICYLTTLTALVAASYSVFSLGACALGDDIFAAYSRRIF